MSDGLRGWELVGLAAEDFKANGLDHIRVLGEGRRGRVLPLWKQARAVLRNWLGVRPDVADMHLSLNAFDTGMTRPGFAKRLALRAATADRTLASIARKTVTPHALQHACALHTLEALGDIRQVALWLGHTSLRSTGMYLRMDPANKLDTLSARGLPNLRKGSFDGVHDELLGLPGGVAARWRYANQNCI